MTVSLFMFCLGRRGEFGVGQLSVRDARVSIQSHSSTARVPYTRSSHSEFAVPLAKPHAALAFEPVPSPPRSTDTGSSTRTRCAPRTYIKDASRPPHFLQLSQPSSTAQLPPAASQAAPPSTQSHQDVRPRHHLLLLRALPRDPCRRHARRRAPAQDHGRAPAGAQLPRRRLQLQHRCHPMLQQRPERRHLRLPSVHYT